MSSFTPRLLSPTAAEPDPTKHVNYNLGMVLGVDDFTQEFAYLSGRDQWLARDLLGYGTVTGLDVGIEIESGGPQVSVTQGVALSPRGRLIRVATAQCASLNGWLASHHDELLERLGSPSNNRAGLRLFVVLGYRECPTDMIPIPGQPCRSEDETTAASRVADDFRLELRFEAPDQQEEDALRDFVAWLSQVEITDEADGMLTVAEFEDAIRTAAYLESSPPAGPPDFMYGSPPERLRIHTSLAYEYLRAAFRVWVTELRPRWQPRFVGKGQTCSGSSGGMSDGDCVMLAEVSLNVVRSGVGADWQVESANSIHISEERRPYLLHLRMVQEWLLGERRATPVESAPALVPGFTVAPETAYGQTPKPGTSLDYARADHTHGTPPPPMLAGDATGSVDATTVVKLRGRDLSATAPNDRQVLAFSAAENAWKATDLARPSTTVAPETLYGQAASAGTSTDYARADHTHGTPPTPTLAGEVIGSVASTIVSKLQGVSVNPTKPTDDNQVLTYNKSLDRWEAKALPAATPPPAPSNAVTSETSFGQTASAGTSAAYSRADHTHGTPTLPNLAGEVTGPVGATVVSKLQGLNVGTAPTTPPPAGQVLMVVSGQWSAAPLPAAPAPPAAATSVNSSTSFGQASAVGTSTAYARADHTHGTPPAPPPPPPAATTVLAANSFGQASAVGTSTSYARADHTHGTPALPAVGGDVGGSIGNMTVMALRNLGVEFFDPRPDHVLTFNGSVWTNRPSAAAGNFVSRPAGLTDYAIVAGGLVSIKSAAGYNELRITSVGPGRINVTFKDYVDPRDGRFQYVVKAMAVGTGQFPGGVVVNFGEFLPAPDGFWLSVGGGDVPINESMLGEMSFMIEVSRYETTIERKF
jgi:hypothetical protein